MINDPPNDGDPSAELLHKWQEHGDRNALDGLLRMEIAILKSRIRRRSGTLANPGTSVSDVAQDAVMRMLAVDPAPHFDNTKAMRAYLWTAAWRLLVTRLRGSDHSVARLDATQTDRVDDALATTGGLRGVEDRDRSKALDLAVQLLQPDEQAILELAYFRDLGIEGAARELGVSHDAAKMRLSRARRSLAKKLAKWTEVIG